MASAVFEGESAARVVRAAIHARRATRRQRFAREFGQGPRRSRASREWVVHKQGIWRGVCASAAIAGGYVAAVAGLRWLLVAAG